MNDGLVDFYKHNLWANLGLLDACAPLTDEQLQASAPGTYGPIRDTLVHLFRAEDSYLARLMGRQPEDSAQGGRVSGRRDPTRARAPQRGGAHRRRRDRGPGASRAGHLPRRAL